MKKLKTIAEMQTVKDIVTQKIYDDCSTIMALYEQLPLDEEAPEVVDECLMGVGDGELSSKELVDYLLKIHDTARLAVAKAAIHGANTQINDTLKSLQETYAN